MAAPESYKKATTAQVDMLMRFTERPDKAMIAPGSEKQGHARAIQGRRYERAGLRRPLPGPAEVRRLCPHPLDQDRGRGREDVRSPQRRRQRDNAADQNLLLAALRRARRPLRGQLDGAGGAIGAAPRGACAPCTKL